MENAKLMRSENNMKESIINLESIIRNYPNHDLAAEAQYNKAEIYLNDIKEGGETVFPMGGTAIQPETGKVAIWPTGLPFYHCGNKSGSDKYILTSWFEFL